jgi:hypothetical protein
MRKKPSACDRDSTRRAAEKSCNFVDRNWATRVRNSYGLGLTMGAGAEFTLRKANIFLEKRVQPDDDVMFWHRGRGDLGAMLSTGERMHPDPQRIDPADLLDELRRSEQALATHAPEAAARVRVTLDQVESATPGGAPLHSQLDNVRKWLDALDHPEEHGRFGGAAHLHAYVLTQLRLALGALEDYYRAM